ncbi:hypothetical protein EGW08_013011, partial [Elysia chlorotica]
MTSKAGCVFKEFHALSRNIDKLTDGQAQVELEDEEDQPEELMRFSLSVCPNAGYYKGARVNFRVRVTGKYPSEPPIAECLNQIYHPNVDISGPGNPNSICVNLLDEDWQPEVGLDGCVIAILFLFHHPNLDDALSHVFSGSSTENDLKDFAENVKSSIEGEEVEGMHFDILVAKDCPTTTNSENGPLDTTTENVTHNTTSDGIKVTDPLKKAEDSEEPIRSAYQGQTNNSDTEKDESCQLPLVILQHEFQPCYFILKLIAL